MLDEILEGGLEIAIGFDFRFMQFDTTDPRVPERLTDQVAGVAVPGVASIDGWKISLLAGAGFAGDQPYSDSNAWYVKGGVVARKQLDRQSSLLVTLTYDGNRAIFPDVPLPGVSYFRFVYPGLQFLVGFPFLGVTWKPIKRLKLDFRGFPPIFFELEASYALSETLEAYALYDSRNEAYHSEALPSNRRLLWQQDLVEAGVRWEAAPWFTLRAAVGYAFNRDLEVGWDVRGTETLARFSDEPFLFFRATLRF